MAVWRFGLKDEIRLQPEGTRVDRYAPHRGRQLAQPGRFAPQIRPLGSAICSDQFIWEKVIEIARIFG